MSEPARPEGLLLVDKPPGITSHDAVAKVRRALGTKKVGHAGTLDPMATGLLVIGVGRATRLMRFLGDLPKRYEGTFRLGARTLGIIAGTAVPIALLLAPFGRQQMGMMVASVLILVGGMALRYSILYGGQIVQTFY